MNQLYVLIKKRRLFFFLLFLVTPQIIVAANITFTVNNNSDSNTSGSLRKAITDANNYILNNSSPTDIVEIVFDLSSYGNQMTIDLYTNLPKIKEGINNDVAVIFNLLNPLKTVLLNGSNIGSASVGLDLQGNNITVEGLDLHNFKTGLIVKGNDCNISKNRIVNSINCGLDIIGNNFTVTGSNIYNSLLSGAGIKIHGGANNIQIGGGDIFNESRNHIYGFEVGIKVGSSSQTDACNGVIVMGNMIGGGFKDPLDCNGINLVGQNEIGISVEQYATKVIIGVNDGGEIQTNMICGNITSGIDIVNNSSGVEIYGNYIGVDMCGNRSENMYGINLSYKQPNSSKVKIGSSLKIDKGNVIAGNKSHGILVYGNNHVIDGNWIGTDKEGRTGLFNGYSPEINYRREAIKYETSTSSNVLKSNYITGKESVMIRGGGHVISENYFGLIKKRDNTYVSMQSTGIALDLNGTTNQNDNNVLVIKNTIVKSSIGVYQRMNGVTYLGNYIGVSAIEGVFNVGNGTGVLVTGYLNQSSYEGCIDVEIGDGSEMGKNVIAQNTIAQIQVKNTRGTIIQGNSIGYFQEKNLRSVNANGIVLESGGPIMNLTIGGSKALNEGNVISGCNMGIIGYKSSIQNFKIQGNVIGLDKEQIVVVPNGRGIYFDRVGNNFLIGGEQSEYGNVICGNNETGIFLQLIEGNNSWPKILSNSIGYNDKSGSNVTQNYGNGTSNGGGGGLLINRCNKVHVGALGSGEIYSNFISNNAPYGLKVNHGTYFSDSYGHYNTIRGNIIRDNLSENYSFSSVNNTNEGLSPPSFISASVISSPSNSHRIVLQADNPNYIIDVYRGNGINDVYYASSTEYLGEATYNSSDGYWYFDDNNYGVNNHYLFTTTNTSGSTSRYLSKTNLLTCNLTNLSINADKLVVNNPPETVNFTSNPTTNNSSVLTYLWEPDLTGNNANTNSVYSPIISSTIDIKLTVTDQAGCQKSAEHKILVSTPNFCKMKPSIDETVYQSKNGEIYFEFIEEYNDTGILEYELFDSNNSSLPNNFVSNTIKKYGSNKFLLDISSLMAGEVYTLKAANSKEDYWYLKFKKTN